MKIHSLSIPLALGLLLTGAGCATTSSVAPTSAPTPTGSPSVAAPSFGLGNCDNPYFPLKTGTKMAYTSKVGNSTPNPYSWEVTEATSDHVNLMYHFAKDTNITSQFACDTSGIRMLSYMNMSMMGGTTQATTKTLSASGNYLPKDLHVGSTWQSSFALEITNNNPTLVQMGMTTSQMNITTENKALSEESVTVPAGTFTAIKVESKSTVVIKYPNAKLPGSTVESTSYNYFVKGKGLVKTESTDTGNAAYSTEATSIVVP